MSKEHTQNQILSPEEQKKRVSIGLAMDFILANLYIHKNLSAGSWSELNHRYCNSQVIVEISNSAFIKAVKQLKYAGLIRDVSSKKAYGIGEVETTKAVKLLPAGEAIAKDRYYWYYRRDYYEVACRSNFLNQEDKGILLNSNPVCPYS
ncbi:MAG: hypothetical protein Q4A21_00195 [bacterium]|nr:hypothetical protein [bacterium]